MVSFPPQLSHHQQQINLPKNDTDLISCHIKTTMRSRRNLTQIQRHRSRDHTRSQTSNDTTDDHHSEIDSSRLDDGAEAQNRDADETSPFSSKSVVCKASEEGETDELSSVEDCSDEALVA